jgi:hypothetical protein
MAQAKKTSKVRKAASKRRSGKKERAYDGHISPLVAEIIKLCKQHKINAAMQFVLDPDPENDGEPLCCNTVLPVDPNDEQGFARVNELRSVMLGRSGLVAMTITTGAPR